MMKAMMFTSLVAALSFLFLGTTAEKFQLKLVPAPDFHLATGKSLADFDGNPIFFFRVADSTTVCENQTLPGREDPETFCGGSFSLNLGLYDGIEISFQAPEGKEIFIQSDEINRVQFEFQALTEGARTEGFCVTEDYRWVNGRNFTTSFIGSDVDSLETLWNPERSYAGVNLCELSGVFQIGGEDNEGDINTRSFTAQASKISWSFEYDPSLFEDSPIEYFYNTGHYITFWIRTPFENALVDAPPSPTTSPSPSSMPSSSLTTSGGCINSITVVATVLFGMLGITSVSTV